LGIEQALHFFVQLRGADGPIAMACPPLLEEHGIALSQWIARLDLRNALDGISAPQCQQWVPHPPAPNFIAA
jgi:hypothetical protein